VQSGRNLGKIIDSTMQHIDHQAGMVFALCLLKRITATVPSFEIASIECKSMQCMLKVSLKEKASERDMISEVDDLISRSSKECGFTCFPYDEKDNIQTWFVNCFSGGGKL
jgi:hypothetical protein